MFVFYISQTSPLNTITQNGTQILKGQGMHTIQFKSERSRDKYVILKTFFFKCHYFFQHFKTMLIVLLCPNAFLKKYFFL